MTFVVKLFPSLGEEGVRERVWRLVRDSSSKFAKLFLFTTVHLSEWQNCYEPIPCSLLPYKQRIHLLTY